MNFGCARTDELIEKIRIEPDVAKHNNYI